MTDPTTAAIVGGVAGAAAGKFIDGAAVLGKMWINNYLQDHHPEAITKAHENSALFLSDLAERVRTIEQSLAESDPISHQDFVSALKDPDFSATLQTALLASSRTPNREKHQILSDAIADRLLAKPDSIRFLATSIAVEVVPHLSSNQLALLGLACVMYVVRPNIIIKNAEIDNPLVISEIEQWWAKSLSPYFPNLLLRHVDYAHLRALRCLDLESNFGRDIFAVMKNSHISPPTWNAPEFLEKTSFKQPLIDIWNNGLQACNLTSIGQLIGMYIHSHKTGNTVDTSAW